jgi:chromosome segregation ATPase
LDEELNKTDETSGSDAGSDSPPDEEPEVKQDEQPEADNDRLAELEQEIAEKDGEIAGLRRDKEELEGKLAAAGASLAEAVAGYRELVVKSNPEIVEDLITGDTIESVNEALEKAKALVSRVRKGVEAEISLAWVPAGAPERTPPDLSALSPREKIQYAIGGHSS